MPSRYRTVGPFLVLSAVWGSAFVAIKAGLDFFPPVLFAALRYDLAAVLVLGYAARHTSRWRPRTPAEYRVVAVGAVLLIAAYHALLFVGEQTTTSAAAAVVVSLSPVLTTSFARILLPAESLGPRGLVGLLLGFLGVVVLAGPDLSGLLAGDLAGELLVFGAVTAFALGSVLTRASPADLPHETMEAWAMAGGAVLLHGVSLALGESPAAVSWTPVAVLALLYLSVVASAVGFLLYFVLLERLGPVEINLVSYVAPLVAALVGWVLLGERPAPTTAVGFLLVVAGFAVVKRTAIRTLWR